MLEQLAQDLELKNVRFVGRVERSEIASFYTAADIFLNTSSIDNMPVSIIEAFAAGLPIVTTNAGGIPFIVKDRENGHMVDVDDHEAIARRLIAIVGDPAEINRLSAAGQGEVKNYSWEVAGPKWIELYAELMGRPVLSMELSQ